MGHVTGVAMVKDEADIIGPIVEHMLGEVDYLIVADNMSSDGTRDILADLASDHPELVVQDDLEVAYMQSLKTTRLAHIARERGAEWVVAWDSDEWWYSPFGRIGDVLAGVGPQWLTCSATLYDHVATGSDPAEANPLLRMGWRRLMPAGLPKVACRTRPDLVIHQGNHGASYNGGTTDFPGQLVVRHFPYRSAEQMVTKARNGAAAYAAATDLHPTAGQHWRDYGRLLEAHGDEALHDVFRHWFFEPFPELRADELIFDPVTGLA
jgi:hypothetical protein